MTTLPIGLFTLLFAQPVYAEGATPNDPVAAKYEALGVTYLPRLEQSLSDHGVADESMDDVLLAMLKVVREAQSEGDSFVLDPRMDAYLAGDLQLDSDQIQHLVRLSRRVAGGLSASANPDKDAARRNRIEVAYAGMGITDLSRIEGSLLDNGIPEEVLDPVLGSMLRVMHQMKTDGESYVMAEGLRLNFEKRLKLDEQQIRHVEALSKRLLKRAG